MARNNQNEEGSAETIIGASVKVEGDLVSEGDIRVDGLVTGKVKTDKHLFVGQGAKIQADIEAGSADVAGEVSGQIRSDSSLTLRESARVRGDIACVKLAIAEGAMFSGNCSMNEEIEEDLSEPLSEEE